MTQDRMTNLRDFASRYTAAWCSGNAASVAAFYSPRGSLTINGGTPSVGRVAITEAAQGFMTAFPDLMVYMDDLLEDGGKVTYKWTLEGPKKSLYERLGGYDAITAVANHLCCPGCGPIRSSGASGRTGGK